MSLTMRQTVQSLYIDHKTWLQEWLKWKIGCIETAEDLSQDVFMRLLGRSEVVTVRRPRAYLGRIARGLVIDHWRRRDIEDAWRKIQADVPEQALPSPEKRLEVIETLVEIDRLLAELKPRMRTAFLLARVEGMTCPCIARHLGVSQATVERDIAAALRHCYRALVSQDNKL